MAAPRPSSAAKGRTRALGGGANIKGSILQVNDVLYVTAPDNVWAVDARDGRTIWHYFWKTRGGIHIGNRGVGIYGDWLFFETPDNYLVSLDARTGKERWHTVIAPFEHQYFSTPAPVDRSATMSSSAPAMTSIRPGSCSRSIRATASCGGSSTPCR